MVTLVALLLAQTLGPPTGPVFSEPSRMKRSINYAFFELAPASGAGMGPACACAPITGAKGETLTVARASGATCMKRGWATTGIQTGDLVSCGNNVPLIEFDGVTNGIAVLEDRTNYAQQSSALGSAPWATAANLSMPVVTNAYAPGPDGVAGSASRVQVPACPAGGTYSVVYQGFFATAGSYNAHAFVKGTSGSGAISIYYTDTGSGAALQVQCSYNPTTWTWCGGPGAANVLANTTANHQVGIGCTNNGITGAGDTGAADVLVAEFNVQNGAWPTNPIPTTSAVASRSFDVGGAIIALPVGLPNAGGCIGTNVWLANATMKGNGGLVSAENVAAGVPNTLIHTSPVDLYVNNTFVVSSIVPGALSFRTYASWGASSTALAVVPGGSLTGAAQLAGAVLDRIRVGAYLGANTQTSAIYSRVVMDPVAARCQ